MWMFHGHSLGECKRIDMPENLHSVKLRSVGFAHTSIQALCSHVPSVHPVSLPPSLLLSQELFRGAEWEIGRVKSFMDLGIRQTSGQILRSLVARWFWAKYYSVWTKCPHLHEEGSSIFLRHTGIAGTDWDCTCKRSAYNWDIIRDW